MFIGPLLVPSFGISMYYLSCIHEFSRNTWIYFLKKKQEVFDKLKYFKDLEKNIENKIKVLRANNYGQLCGNEFEEFYKKCAGGIQKTTKYNYFHNEGVKKMNMKLLEK